MDINAIANEAENLFEEMIEQQRQRSLRVAHRFHPELTLDDIQQPHDYPEVQNDPSFNYEDGILAGLISAQMALRARVWIPLNEDEAFEPTRS